MEGTTQKYKTPRLLLSYFTDMACNKGFSSSYMLLKPEEVRFFDLIHILFSSDLEKRSFVECPEGTEETFRYRWFIFISIWAQKFLQLVATPLAFVGSGIEMWLNLLSSNRNFGVLLLNLLRGQRSCSPCCPLNWLVGCMTTLMIMKFIIPLHTYTTTSCVIGYYDPVADPEPNLKGTNS